MPPTYANGHISATGDPIHFMFGPRVGFSGTADRTALFTVRTNPRWRPPPCWKNFKWRYLRNRSFDRLHVLFYGGFSGTADLMALFPVRTNPRWRPPPSWKNFKWPYLRNRSYISATAHDLLILRASRCHLCDSTAFSFWRAMLCNAVMLLQVVRPSVSDVGVTWS